jgi:hypothetical protein
MLTSAIVYGTWHTDAWTANRREAGFVKLLDTMTDEFWGKLSLAAAYARCIGCLIME